MAASNGGTGRAARGQSIRSASDSSNSSIRTAISRWRSSIPRWCATAPLCPSSCRSSTKLKSYRDVEVASDGAPFPLVVFSHGRGSNGLYYAWFAEFLASRGYIVAALNHYRANTYDSTIAYLANKLWQRPRDVGLTISFLLNDPFWGKSIDAARIGVAGHSQGGFTALWIGGAKVERRQVSRLPARLAQ